MFPLHALGRKWTLSKDKHDWIISIMVISIWFNPCNSSRQQPNELSTCCFPHCDSQNTGDWFSGCYLTSVPTTNCAQPRTLTAPDSDKTYLPLPWPNSSFFLNGSVDSALFLHRVPRCDQLSLPSTKGRKIQLCCITKLSVFPINSI